MDRTRQQMEQHPFLHQHQPIPSPSAWASPLSDGLPRMDDWLLCVDQRLYEAKRRDATVLPLIARIERAPYGALLCQEVKLDSPAINPCCACLRQYRRW
jgi:hypothetical protein